MVVQSWSERGHSRKDEFSCLGLELYSNLMGSGRTSLTPLLWGYRKEVLTLENFNYPQNTSSHHITNFTLDGP